MALSWLPVRSPETLVKVTRRNPRGSGTSFSYPEFAFYRSRSTSIVSPMAIVYGTVDIGDAASVDADFVTANYFADLGARPLMGRLFDAADERAGATPVILLAERFWRTKLGADPAVAGRVIPVNGHPFTIAGVVPDSFAAFHQRTAWIPLTQHREALTGSTLLDDWSAQGVVSFYARLPSTDGTAAAQAELAALAAALHQMRPADSPEGEWLELHQAGRYLPLDDLDNRITLALIASLILLVLVAACMNLGVLVLARTLGREREFGLRLSVGASRGRILRQLVTEHLILGGMGAAAGCFVAVVATRALAVYTGMPSGIMPHFTIRSAAVAAALAIVSSVVFGLTPALQAIRPSASKRLRLRGVLVGVQVAAAGVLLIVSGLLVRGVTRVMRVPLGFEYQQTLIAEPDLARPTAPKGRRSRYWDRRRVRQLPESSTPR